MENFTHCVRMQFNLGKCGKQCEACKAYQAEMKENQKRLNEKTKKVK